MYVCMYVDPMFNVCRRYTVLRTLPVTKVHEGKYTQYKDLLL